MLKPVKKIENKDKSPAGQEDFEHQDAFLEKSYEAEHYVERNIDLFKKYALYVAVLIGLTFAYLHTSGNTEAEANSKFGMAMIDYTTGKTEKARNRFTLLTEEYSGTEAAARAHYFLGKLALEEGLNETARYAFEAYDGSDALLRPAALSGLALTYENDKNYSEAAKYYNEAAAIEMRQEVKINYIIAAAVNLELANDAEGARQIYTNLLANYDSFAKKSLVEQKLAVL
jgi:tetratricopeptide (TPR) repeat protein